MLQQFCISVVAVSLLAASLWVVGCLFASAAWTQEPVTLTDNPLEGLIGQYLNPIPTDGMKAFVLGLRDAGFTGDKIELMCRRNPGRLLGDSS